MVLYLLKRDDSVKVALVCALLAPCVLLSGRFGPLVFLQQLAFIGVICGIRLGLFHRSTRFQMALPIPGRDLLLVKIAGTLLAIWFPIAIASLFLAAKHRDGWQSLLQGGAVLTFGAILPLTVRLREASISSPVSIGLSVSVLAAGLGAWFVLPPLVHVALFAALSVVFLWRAFRLVPAAFEVSSARFTWAPPTIWLFPAPVWWALARTIMPWVGALMFLWGYCSMVSIIKMFPYVSVIFGFGVLCRTRMVWLYGLPVSGRAILWLTLAVTVVPFLAGVAAGTWIYRPGFIPPNRPWVGQFMGNLDERDSHLLQTNVALEYWRPAPGGKVSLIEAPWRESAVPRSISILGFVFYNPYTATKANSDRFFEWQFENATQVLHGRRIAYRQYLEMRNYDRPEYPQQKRLDVVAFRMLVFWALFGACLHEVPLSRRLSGKRFVRALPLACAFFIGGGFILGDAISMALFDTMIFTSLLQALFMQVAALPLPTWALAAIGALSCLLMYLLLEWQCARSEMVNNPAITTAP